MSSHYEHLVTENIMHAFRHVYANRENDETYEAFASQWGGLMTEQFQRALEYGDGNDRLRAIFAISASALPDAAELLLPFLSSRRREERCVSAIALGMQKDERAYPYLEALLFEGLSLDEYEQTTEKREPDVYIFRDKSLCERFRLTALTLLDGWSSPTLINTLIQTLKALWALEMSSDHVLIDVEYYNKFFYALGQRGMFTVLDDVGFPPVYQKIAMVYLALGFFQIQERPNFRRQIHENEDLQQHIDQFLAEHFGMDAKEQSRCLYTFYSEYEVHHIYWNSRDNEAVEKALERHFAPVLASEASAIASQDEVAQEEEEQERVIDHKKEKRQERVIDRREPSYVCVYRGHVLQILSLSWSPDGSMIVSSSTGTTAEVWSCQTRKKIRVFREHEEGVSVVAWSPDGEWIASGGCDNRVFVWEALSGEIVTIYQKHTAWICKGLAWSPDGTQVASAAWDGTVHIWEAATGKTRVIYQGHHGIVTSVAWSPDGTLIVSGGGYPECAIHVWDATIGQLIYIYKAHMDDREEGRPGHDSLVGRDDEVWTRGPSSVRSVAWSPDGDWIASVGLRGVFRVWCAATGEDLVAGELNGSYETLVWSPDSRYLSLAYGNSVSVWDRAQKRVTINYAPISRQEIHALAWSPDGQYMAAGGDYTTVGVWRADL